ncbi:MAG: hypothetical protein H6734_26185 [Alphaproteobacteria bacterium]|nr:hypothetical protein [Alphaproteobacteria bacterium]
MSRDLDSELDGLDGSGRVRVEREGGAAEIDVERAGPIGARVRRVRVERDQPWDIAERARALEGRLRSLPEKVEAQEIAPELGGAILRTVPGDLRGKGFYEVEVGPRSAEVRRVRLEGSERTEGEFDMTREQLGRLLDELDG